MVKSNLYKIVKFSKDIKRTSMSAICFKPILNNKNLDVCDRTFIYGYSQLFHKKFKTKFKPGCLVSGRNRGVLSNFYISRITFKEYAITGILNGFKKSRW